MEQQLETIKTEFSIVKENIYAIINNLATVKKKLDMLKQTYSDMISANSNKKIFLFCLESFNFQIKSFNVDTDNLHKSLLLVSNRIYCDYYKLLKLIRIIFDEYKYGFPKELVELPAYNVLNPLFEYSVDDIVKNYANVCLLIQTLIDCYNNNHNNIECYKTKLQTGICILNFIKTLEYDNSVLKDQIVLYLNYLDFFKTNQTKHLVKLLGKMNALQYDISSEIVDEPPLHICASKDVKSEYYFDSPSAPNTTPTSKDEFNDFVLPFVTESASSKSNSSTEKKPAPEEKPAKKKGRPRTKGVVETKSVNKIEEIEEESQENFICMTIIETDPQPHFV